MEGTLKNTHKITHTKNHTQKKSTTNHKLKAVARDPVPDL